MYLAKGLKWHYNYTLDEVRESGDIPTKISNKLTSILTNSAYDNGNKQIQS